MGSLLSVIAVTVRAIRSWGNIAFRVETALMPSWNGRLAK
jgi:hypothetical protein